MYYRRVDQGGGLCYTGPSINWPFKEKDQQMHEDHAYFFTCPSTRQNPVLDYPLIKLINSTATVPRTR